MLEIALQGAITLARINSYECIRMVCLVVYIRTNDFIRHCMQWRMKSFVRMPYERHFSFVLKCVSTQHFCCYGFVRMSPAVFIRITSYYCNYSFVRMHLCEYLRMHSCEYNSCQCDRTLTDGGMQYSASCIEFNEFLVVLSLLVIMVIQCDRFLQRHYWFVQRRCYTRFRCIHRLHRWRLTFSFSWPIADIRTGLIMSFF